MLHMTRDYLYGAAAFYKLLRTGRLREVNKLLESARIAGCFQVTKYENSPARLRGEPYVVGEPFHNLLCTAGLALLWSLTTGQGGTAFSAANAYLGVGDTATAADPSQTDLQASSNKVRRAMNGTYPATPSGGIEIFQADFGSTYGNWHWQEFGVFNAGPTGGTMLNRAVQDQGTKVAGQTWTLTATITIS